MKKVLFIITRLAAGGAPAIALSMLRSLKENGYDVELATGLAGKDEEDLLPEVRDSGFKVTVIPELVRDIHPVKDLLALNKLRRFMKDSVFDVVHTHTIKAGILGRLAARQAGVAHIIHSPHGSIFRGYINPLLVRAYIRLERLAARWSHKIITLTYKEIEESLCLKIGTPDQFRCIYNGIETGKYAGGRPAKEELRRQMNIPGPAIVLVTAGRLVPVKGHSFLLQALSALAAAWGERQREWRCLIVGDGELKESLKDKARELGVAGHVLFPGQRENVADYLRVSDIFVLPSVNEGFGLAVVEAMAAGLPVVATRVGGVPEIVIDGRNGILVPPENAPALAEGILTLADDQRQRVLMGEENQRRAKEEFSLEKMNKEVNLLYTEVVGSS